MKLLLLLSVAALLFVVGCGKKTADTPTVVEHPLAGAGTKTWHYYGEAAAGKDVEKGSGEERKATWTFKTDGSYTAIEGTSAMTGTYTYAGNSLSLKQSGNDSTVTVVTVVTVDKQKLVLKVPDGTTMEMRAE